MITLNDFELEALLAEDLPYGDLTTTSLGITKQHARITFSTRDRPLVVSCMEEAVRLCGLYELEIDGFVKSGTFIPPKSVFLEAHGEVFVQALNKAKKTNPEKKIVVEVGDIAEYPATGVDMIVTSSPYSVQPADIKVRIEPL
jgi:nicotinate-nucleotide pyrophosphorylase